MQNGPTQPPEAPPPPIQKKKDSLGFVDSPWVQLGVPMAATIASAIAPRHMGRAAAGTIGTLDSVNQYRYGQKRLSEMQASQEFEEQQAQEKSEREHARVSSLQSFVHDYSQPGAGGPEGGSVPQADMNAKTEALEDGAVPKMTAPPITPLKGEMYSKMAEFDPGMVEELVKGDVSSYGKEKQGMRLSDARGNYSGLGPGESVSGVPLEGGGAFSFNPIEPGAGKAPDMRVVEENGQSVAVYFSPDGVQKKIPIGHAGGTPAEKNTMMTNFNAKLQTRSMGKATGDASFDNTFSAQEAAEVLKNQQKANPLAMMMQMFMDSNKGGVAPAP